jgi:hypothetical protein
LIDHRCAVCLVAVVGQSAAELTMPYHVGVLSDVESQRGDVSTIRLVSVERKVALDL